MSQVKGRGNARRVWLAATVAVAIGLGLAGANSARAAPFCFSLGVDEGLLLNPNDPLAMKMAMWTNNNFIKASYNMPLALLTNTSNSLNLLNFEITIGKPLISMFESAAVIGTAQTVSPASVTTSLLADVVSLQFLGGGLKPGESVLLRLNIGPTDPNGDQFQPFYKIFFDLGGNSDADNSLLTLAYSDGSVVQMRLPDYAMSDQIALGDCAVGVTTVQGMYTSFNHFTMVPEPGSILLFGLGGLGLLALAAWRRRYAA